MANEKRTLTTDEDGGNVTVIELATILSQRTKQGMVEFSLNGVKTQWDIRKAKEICEMLHGAIEAAISDTLIHQFLIERIGMKPEVAGMALIDFREMRQGSKASVFPA